MVRKSIRIREDLKNSFQEYCNKKNMLVSEACRFFVTDVVENGCLPSWVIRNANFTDKQLNAKNICICLNENIFYPFKEICDKNGVTYSFVFKSYMAHCVSTLNEREI